MKKIKNIISEEINHYLLKEYSNNDLGVKLDMAVSNIEQILSEIEDDIENRLRNGDKTVSRRDSMISSLEKNIVNLRKLTNIINRNRI